MLSSKEIDEQRLNLKPMEVPPMHVLFDFHIEHEPKPCFRIYDASGHKLFGNHFEVDNWNKFVSLVNRFDKRYQAYLEKRECLNTPTNKSESTGHQVT